MATVDAVDRFADPYLGETWQSLGALRRVEQRGAVVQVDATLGYPAEGLKDDLAQRLSGRLAGDSPLLRRWGFASMVSQAGLTLGLSAVIVRTFPSIGDGLRSLVVATVAINEVVGPIFFKLALERADEVRS